MHSDREWLVPMAIVAAVQLALWCVLWRAGLAGAPLVGLYNIIALAGIGIALIPFFLLYLLKLYREGEDRPMERIRGDFDRGRALAVALGIAVGGVSAGAFSALKSAIPLVVPFYLDPGLASFERKLFGIDPWRITHALLGWATPAFDKLYISWLFVMLIAFNLVLLARPSEFKTRSMLAYVLVWPVVGTLGGYALSSAGPIFHDALLGGHSGLLAALQSEGATGTLTAYHYLWNAYANRFETVGGGISAMPSLHIAMACWLALTVRERFPRFQWLGWTYFGLIWLGSIHLGWHYFSDGAVGTAGSLLVWRAAGAWATRTARSGVSLAPEPLLGVRDANAR